MGKTLDRTAAVSRREIVVLTICAALVAGLILTNSHARPPIASSETRFVDHSEGGMQIVPASCPSSPHYSGECSGDPPPEPSSGCVLYRDPTTISPGESSTLHWSVADYSLFGVGSVSPSGTTISPTVGSVPSSGSADVSPTVTTTYTLHGVYDLPGSLDQTFSCSRTVTVRAPQCENVTFSCIGNSVRNSCTGERVACPVGHTCSNGQCVCTPTLGGGSCQTQCTDSYYCSANDLWKSNTCGGNSFVQTCAYGCGGGACLTPANPDGTITASPALIHRGDTSVITWGATSVASCTVTENNPQINDSWTGVSDSKTSSPLTEQTKYTLTCQGVAGASPASFEKSVIVNIIPVWVEE